MNSRFCVVAFVSVSPIASSALANKQFQVSASIQKEASVSTHAAGRFEVKITPQDSNENTQDASLGRVTIDKRFHGDLEGVSKGQMLTAGTSVRGSAGYVAIEKVSGTLNGRNGTLILQHTATMTRGVPQLSITVVPDSATGQLAGISGKMNININDGKHSYDFEYTLAETQ